MSDINVEMLREKLYIIEAIERANRYIKEE